jgi:Escherichia/Staphylococcus phage prohead protease
MSEERRSILAQTTIDFRSGRPKIVGYAAVFNSPSEPLPLKGARTFREVVLPGAFSESLSSVAEIFALAEHRDYLGRTGNGTLRVTEDHRGLRYEIDPPDTEAGRDVLVLVRRRDLAAASFAFRVKPGGDSWRSAGGQTLRELRSVQLLDVSLTMKPAYRATDAALRSFDEWQRSGGLLQMRLDLAERT